MISIDDMMIFAQVVENQSFTQAAETLNLGKSRVSQIITKLETELDTRLLNRTTRSLSLTDAGEIYYKKCRLIREIALEANTEITDTTHRPSGTIRISTPSFALIDVLSEFMHLHPEINLDIIESDSYSNLIESRCDLAVRASSALEDSSLYAIKMGYFCDMLCASPEYLEKVGMINHPQDLLNLDWISHEIVHSSNVLRLTSCNGQTISLKHKPKIQVRTTASVKGFVLNHLGFAIMPSFVIRDELNSGQLIRILPQAHDLQIPFYIVYQEKSLMPLRVRTLIEFLKQKGDCYQL
ncbi:LysR family transcriptional regulator [Photobacterium damselae]|uniref:LysR family transcriptional regulator n=1 Tax=Photobacterium damselae TaxID=38293 RepID=A0ABD6X4X0_PHODM|nr:LysR family transcriptional regulator [Photobacterium damselae]OBU42601.1 LysR family transcriptional regulator [Photobacterium damselae]PSU17373.1 LysR family transcriptional regulator [Photobacterium damselae]